MRYFELIFTKGTSKVRIPFATPEMIASKARSMAENFALNDPLASVGWKFTVERIDSHRYSDIELNLLRV